MRAQPKQAAARAVDDIISDLCDRRGLRQEWKGIDKDIQKEICNAWRVIVERAIRSALPSGGGK